MPLAPRPISCFGTLGHGVQDARVPGTDGRSAPVVPPESASPEPLGAKAGTVQPAVATTTAASSPTTKRERRGTVRGLSTAGLARTRLAGLPARQHLGQVELHRTLQLFVGARVRITVGPPPLELSGMPETDALHVVVAHFDNPLRAQRSERQVLAVVPAAHLVLARGPFALLVSRPV